MTRHGKNSTAGAVYTYHERQKDAEQSGFGSKNVRLGKDSVKEFDCCSLTLQPCRDPVVTLDGYLYDKEAILECLLHQKREIARKMKAFEKQKKKTEREEHELRLAFEKSKVDSFEKLEKRLTTKPHDAFSAGSAKDEPSSSSAWKSKGYSPVYILPLIFVYRKHFNLSKMSKESVVITHDTKVGRKWFIHASF